MYKQNEKAVKNIFLYVKLTDQLLFKTISQQSGRSPKVVALFSASVAILKNCFNCMVEFKLNEIMDESTIIWP